MNKNQNTSKLRNTSYVKWATKNIRLKCRHNSEEYNHMAQKKHEPKNSLFNQAIMGIAYLDKEGHVIDANKAFLDLVQYSLEELQQIPFSHIIYPADLKEDQTLRKAIQEGSRKDYSLVQRYIRKDGELIWVSAHTSCIREDRALSAEMVVFAHDISSQKRHEQELLEANSIKNKFFAIIGHDLRNPIESIKIMTGFIEHELENNNIDSIKEIVALLSDQAEHTQKLLSNLLKWSQAQTKQITFNPKQLNIHKIVSDQLKEAATIAANKKIMLKHDIDKDIWIDVDHEMLKIILRNLVTNAIKFSYAESTVWIKVQERFKDVLITVEDHGKGIHPIIFEKLFHLEPKTSTNGTQNERGTGLGLLLCKEFVEYHGGKIWAETSLNKGSKFLFTLPKTQ